MFSYCIIFALGLKLNMDTANLCIFPTLFDTITHLALMERKRLETLTSVVYAANTIFANFNIANVPQK